MAPRQSELALEETGIIKLEAGKNFEQALADLVGIERIWLIYWFHRNDTWKAKVATPRGGPKRGLFATRSPHRPNPIGLSCVELLGIEGRTLIVGKHDLLDGTPILDIKPYLPYADAFPNSKPGWIESGQPTKDYNVEWADLAQKQAVYIQQEVNLDIVTAAQLRLSENPFPFRCHRIKKLGEKEYELAIKTWRLLYHIEDYKVIIQKIISGYDEETLQGKKSSQWDDVSLHREFQKQFGL